MGVNAGTALSYIQIKIKPLQHYMYHMGEGAVDCKTSKNVENMYVIFYDTRTYLTTTF